MSESMSQSITRSFREDTQTLVGERQRNLMDVDTGEMIHVDQITKRTYGSKQFWKMYLADFLAVLGIFDSKQLDVFIYIAENTQPANNVFLGTQEKIASATGTSRPTVQRIMKKLLEQGFIKRISPGAYFVNPNIIMKGNDQKRQMLLTWERSDFENDETISMVRGKRAELKRAEELGNGATGAAGNRPQLED